MTRAMKRARGSRGLDSMLAAREMIVVCGAGGVGKTTVAASLGALAASELGGRVLVLTVDPARRLANALGLESFGNVEHEVPVEMFTAAGVEPRGTLHAAMLDMRAGWDELITRHAPDDETREAVLGNPMYRNVTGRFVHSHEYLAMERLQEVHASGRYDLVIVDTPPSRHALDVLDAPRRMIEFFESRLLRWMTVPSRSRLVGAASKPFYAVADRVLGSRFIEDIAEFFELLRRLEPAFVEQARAVERLLGDERTSFVVVSSLEPSSTAEVHYFAEALAGRELAIDALVLNRTLPSALFDPPAVAAAVSLGDIAADPVTVGGLAAGIGDTCDPRLVASVLDEVSRRFVDLSVVARRESERRVELAELAPLMVEAPALDVDVTDLAALLRLGRHLVG
jgi:anion-transporting  ArsA/GET3 family ATPase